jgi:hypothetical protein
VPVFLDPKVSLVCVGCAACYWCASMDQLPNLTLTLPRACALD